MSAFMCVVRLDFHDSGDPEFIVLHEGTEDECNAMADSYPGLHYKGKRPIARCRVGVFKDKKEIDLLNS